MLASPSRLGVNVNDGDSDANSESRTASML